VVTTQSPQGGVADVERVDDETGTGVDDASEEALPLDVTFEMLKNRRRRLVLSYLRENGETTRIGDLAEHIAAIENDTDVAQLNSQQRKRVYIGLYQCHLPKMDDAGVVDFNQDRGLVDLRENADQLYAYLDPDETSASRVGFRPYAALTGGFGVAFAVAELSNVQAAASATVVGLLVAVLCLAYYDSRAS
jgi:hypothetical protein